MDDGKVKEQLRKYMLGTEVPADLQKYLKPIEEREKDLQGIMAFIEKQKRAK